MVMHIAIPNMIHTICPMNAPKNPSEKHTSSRDYKDAGQVREKDNHICFAP